jgi:flagella basal body P-ring formation protein FlgA
VFRPSELGRLASAAGVKLVADREICVERRTVALSRESMLAAMQRELPGARIEILQSGPSAAPEGELQFPLAGLRQRTDGATWRGFVRYANGRRFSVWADVRVYVRAPRIVAAADLAPGRAVEPTELRLQDAERPYRPGLYAGSVEEVAGRSLRRSVKAGTPIEKAWVDAPVDVRSGETVRVEVRSGGARLAFDGTAEGSGTSGDSVMVRNPETGKRLRAWITGKGSVVAGDKRL